MKERARERRAAKESCEEKRKEEVVARDRVEKTLTVKFQTIWDSGF